MRPLLVFAFAPALLGQDIAGVFSCGKTGVQQNGRTVAWRDVASLEEREPDYAAEYAAQKQGATAQAQFELGRWCRERSLPQAEMHFVRALELDPKHEGALCALGRAQELVDAQRRALQPLPFADWCRDRALCDQQWQTLVTALARNNYDREAIHRIKPILERQCGTTLLRPPFTGRWQAIVDTVQHHQQKCFAVFAIDFAMVDAAGKRHRGTGKELADWYGFDQPVLAAADGEVTQLANGFADNPPGKAGGFDQANFVEIRHREGESTTYAHVKKGSVCVTVGQRVKAGEVIAHCGNSGASGLPHVHFTMDFTLWPGSEGVVLGRPYRFGGCRLVEVQGQSCSVELRAARPQEGWILDCPAGNR